MKRKGALIIALLFMMTVIFAGCGTDQQTAQKEDAAAESAETVQTEQTQATAETTEVTEATTEAVTTTEATTKKATTTAKPTTKKATQKATKKPAKESKAKKETTKKKETAKASKATKAKKPTKSKKEIARSYIGKSASSLEAAIGSPKSKSYADSCMGSGEDGQWQYSGFTVYTYRENGKETVQDVE